MKNLQKIMQYSLLIVLSTFHLGNQVQAKSNHELITAVLHNPMTLDDLHAQEFPIHAIILNQNYTTQEKINAIQKLLDNKDIDVNMQDEDGKTALNLITFYKASPMLAQLLLDYKANVNIPDRFNQSPLHNAVANEEIEIAQMLLQANADPYLKNDTLQTPVDLARSAKTQALFERDAKYEND